MNTTLAAELMAMRSTDLNKRRELIERGELYGPHLSKDWYHPEMAAVHGQNNQRLREILAEVGWPGVRLVGAEGCEAAWLIAQHAVLDVPLQAIALDVLTEAVQRDDAPAWCMAMLTDRVCMGRGEPQIYGCISIGNEAGELVPYPIADEAHVEERRAAVGLPPLAELMRQHRERVALESAVQKAAQGGK